MLKEAYIFCVGERQRDGITHTDKIRKDDQ